MNRRTSTHAALLAATLLSLSTLSIAQPKLATNPPVPTILVECDLAIHIFNIPIEKPLTASLWLKDIKNGSDYTKPLRITFTEERTSNKQQWSKTIAPSTGSWVGTFYMIDLSELKAHSKSFEKTTLSLCRAE